MCLLSQRRKREKGQAGCVDYFLEVPLERQASLLILMNKEKITVIMKDGKMHKNPL
jgi:hypothetical protein